MPDQAPQGEAAPRRAGNASGRSCPGFEPRIGPTVEALAELSPSMLAPAHCTGRKACHQIAMRIIERSYARRSLAVFSDVVSELFSARDGVSVDELGDVLRDDGGMIDLRWAILVVLVVAAAAVSACGTSSSSTSASTSSTSTTAGAGSGVAAARQKCLDATKKIENSTARSTAEQACNHVTTSNANVSTALGQAKQACLTAAAKIPIASVKQSAQAQCSKITAP